MSILEIFRERIQQHLTATNDGVALLKDTEVHLHPADLNAALNEIYTYASRYGVAPYIPEMNGKVLYQYLGVEWSLVPDIKTPRGNPILTPIS